MVDMSFEMREMNELVRWFASRGIPPHKALNIMSFTILTMSKASEESFKKWVS